MFSQSLPAQLARWAMLLSITLVAVHHCQPLLDVLAEQAMAAGCHQHDSVDSSAHQHHHHH